MAKGQKKSNREVRKPKQAKTVVQTISLLGSHKEGAGRSSGDGKRTRD
ncbi:MAG TPA: hypothetical protein VHY32_01000 [Caulobacteraceae bacterium]|jgi:hypothetical protein|nr:hypothetical protein [Caulobacteraceae bacterium]